MKAKRYAGLNHLAAALLAATVGLALPGCAEKDLSSADPEGGLSLEQILASWQKGDQPVAIQQFLDTDWRNEGVFRKNSPLRLREAKLRTMSEPGQSKVMAQLLTQLKTIKAVARAVRQKGESASQADPQLARRCAGQLNSFGARLERVGDLKVVKALGLAIRDMAKTDSERDGVMGHGSINSSSQRFALRPKNSPHDEIGTASRPAQLSETGVRPLIERLTGDGEQVMVEGQAFAGTRIVLSVGASDQWECPFRAQTHFTATLRHHGRELDFAVHDQEKKPLLQLTGISAPALRSGRIVLRRELLKAPPVSLVTVGLVMQEGQSPAYIHLRLEENVPNKTRLVGLAD